MKRVLTTVEIIGTKIQLASGSDAVQVLWALACGSRTVDEVFSEIGFDTEDNLLLLLQYMF